MSKYGCIMPSYGCSDNKIAATRHSCLGLNHGRFDVNIKTILFGFDLHAGSFIV
jgi:hypothetical protein